MIDDSDSREFGFLAVIIDCPWISLPLLVIAIFLGYRACKNEELCKTKLCPPGMSIILDHHRCECVMEAK